MDSTAECCDAEHGQRPPDAHYELSAAERPVLALIAQGKSDAEIELALELTNAAVHSLIRRFRERTGLSGRLLAVWCREHRRCCISIAN